MKKNLITLIKENQLFYNVDLADICPEGIKGSLINLDPGEVLFKESEGIDAIYLVLEGSINLIKKQNVINSDIIDSGCFFSDVLETHQQFLYTAVALTDATLLAIESAELYRLIKRDKNIRLNLEGKFFEELNNYEKSEIEKKDQDKVTPDFNTDESEDKILDNKELFENEFKNVKKYLDDENIQTNRLQNELTEKELKLYREKEKIEKEIKLEKKELRLNEKSLSLKGLIENQKETRVKEKLDSAKTKLANKEKQLEIMIEEVKKIYETRSLFNKKQKELNKRSEELKNKQVELLKAVRISKENSKQNRESLLKEKKYFEKVIADLKSKYNRKEKELEEKEDDLLLKEKAILQRTEQMQKEVMQEKNEVMEEKQKLIELQEKLERKENEIYLKEQHLNREFKTDVAVNKNIQKSDDRQFNNSIDENEKAAPFELKNKNLEIKKNIKFYSVISQGIKIICINIERATFADAVAFKNYMLSELTTEKKLIVDLSKSKYIDSTFLGALLSSLKVFKKNEGEFKLVIGKSVQSNLLILSQVDKMFHVYESLQMAIEALNEKTEPAY